MSRLRRSLRGGAAAVAASVVVVTAADAQTVRLSARNAFDREARQRIEEAIEAGRYRIWTRDTILVAGDTVDGDVFLLRATARLSGTVAGQVIGIESEVFVRPGAEIRGGAVVLNGGYYGTQLARVGPVFHLPIADYRVRERERDGETVYEVRPPRAESRLSTLGVSGLILPGYERVSALTVPWGVEYRPPPGAWPRVRALVRYRTARGRADGELRLRSETGPFAVTAEGGRTTATRDAWISGELENTLASLGFAADHRNYYDAKFARAGLELRQGRRVRLVHGLAVEWEEAASLRNRDPFSFFESEGGFRPNPAVADGRLALLRAATELSAAPGRSAIRAAASWEVADRGVAGDFTYTRAAAEADWEAPTFGRQRLRVRGRAGGPLAGTVPPQRWTALGGYKTLPTFDPLSLRGDTYLFVQSTYFVPLLTSGLGDVTAWVQHAVGSAWEGARPPFEQNLGVGLDLGPFAVWLFGDPGASNLDLTPGFGLKVF